MFVDSSKYTEEEANHNTDYLNCGETQLKEIHIDQEGEADSTVAHDSDRGRISPLVDAGC